MAAGDIKTFDFVLSGLTLQVIAIDNGDGTTDFQVKCLTGRADVNALWWADSTLDGSSPTLSGSGSSLNMNGTGVDWDGYQKLSDTGLGKLGWDKVTALSAGESTYANDVVVDWNSISTLGVRATSTNHPRPPEGPHAGSRLSGLQSRYSGLGKKKPRGITPITVVGVPSRTMRLPTMAGSPPSSCCQSP